MDVVLGEAAQVEQRHSQVGLGELCQVVLPLASQLGHRGRPEVDELWVVVVDERPCVVDQHVVRFAVRSTRRS